MSGSYLPAASTRTSWSGPWVTAGCATHALVGQSVSNGTENGCVRKELSFFYLHNRHDAGVCM
jgi:hypothetical protein